LFRTSDSELRISPEGPRSGDRIAWVDHARGIGILLVVYGHVMRGLYHASVPVSPSFFQYTDRLVYGFHMPLFFFLAGLFVEDSFEKKRRTAGPGASAWKGYVGDKVKTLAYPYFLWSLIEWTANFAAARYTNDAATLEELISIVYVPYHHFWFLYVLFLCYVFFLPVRKAGKGGILAAAVLMHLCYPYVTVLCIKLLLRYFLYFAAGVVLKDFVSSFSVKASPGRLALCAAGFYGLLAGLVLRDWGINPTMRVICAAAGIAATICFAAWLAPRKDLLRLRLLGFLSMPVYLAHVLAASGTRILLQKVLHVQDAWIHFFAGMAAGVLLPVALYYAAGRLRLPYLFTLSKRSSFAKGLAGLQRSS